MEGTDNDEDPYSKSQEKYMREFIKIYKENRVLWDKNDPNHKSRRHREASYDLLINKSLEYFPEADADFVRGKIDNLRGSFRRQYKKVEESKKTARSNDDIYVPRLWYYNLLLFLSGEQIDEDLDANEDKLKFIYSWTKHDTVQLIDLMKKHPILCSLDMALKGSKLKRDKAYRKITDELTAETGRQFKLSEVKHKISALKQQCRKDRASKKESKSWCYDLLAFLKDSSFPKKEGVINEEQDFSYDEAENLYICHEPDSDSDRKDDSMFTDASRDDIFDTIGKNVAIKLRDMEDDQRMYAINLINEILYHGLMGNLTADSRLSLNGE